MHPAPTPPALVVPGAPLSDAESLGAKVRLPALAADGATRDGCGGVTECAANRRVIGVAEVLLLPHVNHFLSSGK
jgi:hypothetical protein